MDAQKDVKNRRILTSFSLRADEEHAIGFDTVTGIQTACQILFTDAENTLGLNAAFHLLREFLEFNKLGIDKMRGLLLEKEPRLALWPATASVDLDALQRFDEFLFVGLIQLHGVATRNALKHGRIQARADAGDFRSHCINGDHASNVIRTELRNRTNLVAWEVDDANEWHQIAFACIEKKLTKRLIGSPEMMVGIAQNVLRKLMVVPFNLSERDLK